MPQYLDHHPTIPMPAEVVEMITKRLRDGERDEFGEVGLNVFIGPKTTHCYTDAPNPEAVRKSHEALGITLRPEDVVEVTVLP